MIDVIVQEVGAVDRGTQATCTTREPNGPKKPRRGD